MPLEINVPQEVQKIEKIVNVPKIVLKSINNQLNKNVQNREIFGISRHSYTESESSTETNAKIGNTLAKVADNEKLKESDADNLPTPTESYLVSQMPRVLKEVRPEYPKEARDKQIEGAVIMDILIDSFGAVRDVQIVEGPNIFNDTAKEAIKKFIFSPAVVSDQKVAVRIRYTLRFKLDY